MYDLSVGRHKDLADIAACHRACFPRSFSSKLGIDYLKKTLEWFLAGDNRFLLYATEGKQVVGYCGGFISQHFGDGSTSGMLQYAMTEGIKGVAKKPWLLLHPEIVAKYPLLFRNIGKKFRGSRSPKNQTVEITGNGAFEKKVGLVVIGVHPSFRGKGVFEMLMKRFEEEALSRSMCNLTLSVKKNNQRAIKAYENAGWEILKTDKKGLIMGKTLAG